MECPDSALHEAVRFAFAEAFCAYVVRVLADRTPICRHVLFSGDVCVVSLHAIVSVFVVLICGRLSYAKKLNIFYLLSSFLVLHFSYGCGSIAGLWSVLWEKSNK